MAQGEEVGLEEATLELRVGAIGVGDIAQMEQEIRDVAAHGSAQGIADLGLTGVARARVSETPDPQALARAGRRRCHEEGRAVVLGGEPGTIAHLVAIARAGA